MLFRNERDTENKFFWLASRCVNISIYDSYGSEFAVRYVHNGHLACSYFARSAFSSVGGNGYGVVPVVSLESNILTSGKDASGVWQLKVE